MGSDDSSPDSVNLETYLSTWERLGFDATSFRDDVTRAKPSEFVELQATVESAHELKSRMKPFQSSEIVQQLTDHFRNPQDLKDVEDQFNRWSAVNAPWESGYYRWYPRWSITEELQDQFWNIINIAALLDESSLPHGPGGGDWSGSSDPAVEGRSVRAAARRHRVGPSPGPERPGACR